jgi:hypothetical protein
MDFWVFLVLFFYHCSPTLGHSVLSYIAMTSLELSPESLDAQAIRFQTNPWVPRETTSFPGSNGRC